MRGESQGLTWLLFQGCLGRKLHGSKWEMGTGGLTAGVPQHAEQEYPPGPAPLAPHPGAGDPKGEDTPHHGLPLLVCLPPPPPPRLAEDDESRPEGGLDSSWVLAEAKSVIQ